MLMGPNEVILLSAIRLLEAEGLLTSTPVDSNT